MQKITVKIFLTGISLFLSLSGYASQLTEVNSLKIASIFSDHMVLQQNCKVNLWGKAAPGKRLVVSGSWGKHASTKTGADGKWTVKLATPAAGGPYFVIIQDGVVTIVIKDVLIGEVWLASGQSNMDIPLSGWPPDNLILNSKQEISDAKYPTIRFMKVPFGISAKPRDVTGGEWIPLSPETAGNVSATAYFFARKLQQELNVPIGIVQSSIGGTPAEAWTSSRYLLKLGDFDNAIAEENDSAKLNSNSPTVLFNAMINPLVPYTIKGVIWYQGESNVGRAAQYKKLFPLLIADWRNQWGYVLPFYYVQIAPFLYSAPDQKEQSPKLRNAQRFALKLAKTGMVSTLDIGYLKTAHPPNKQEVGNRLARFALANEYEKNVTVSGPLYQKTIVSGNTLIIKFKFVGSGLVAGANGLNNFEMASNDKIYVKADAQIIRNTVVVSSRLISNPLYVRYAWSDASCATLFNKEGLPAATFTSDDKN